MPIQGVQNNPLHAPLLNQNVQQGENVPAALGHASTGPSKGRIILGILTLGLSEGIRAIVHHCRAAGAHEAPAPQVAPALAQPQAEPQADFDNQHLARSLDTLDPQSSHGQAIREGLDAVRDAFPGILPAGDTLSAVGDALNNSSIESSLKSAVRGSAEEVTPQALSRMTQDAAKPVAARTALKAEIRELVHAKGLAVDDDRIGWISSALRTRHPEAMENLIHSENLADLRAALEPLRDEMQVLARRESDCSKALGEARDGIFRSVAEATGLPEAEIRTSLNMTKLDDSFNILRKDMMDTANAASDPAVSRERFQEVFTAKADRFATQKSALYTSVDGFALSPRVKTEWKREALNNISLTSGFFLQKCDTVGGRMDPSSLLRALGEPGVTEQELLGLLKSLYAQMDAYSHEAFTPQEYAEVGGHELGCMASFSLEAFLDKNPEVGDGLRADPDRFERLRQVASDDFDQMSSMLARDFSGMRRREYEDSTGVKTLLEIINHLE